MSTKACTKRPPCNPLCTLCKPLCARRDVIGAFAVSEVIVQFRNLEELPFHRIQKSRQLKPHAETALQQIAASGCIPVEHFADGVTAVKIF